VVKQAQMPNADFRAFSVAGLYGQDIIEWAHAFQVVMPAAFACCIHNPPLLVRLAW